MKQKLIIGFIVFISILKLQAQSDFRKGYYINNSSDTIYGLIKYKGINASKKRCVFKENINSENQIFSPDQIKGYRYLDSKNYVSKHIETENKNEEVFLEYLINGIVDIYYYRDDLGEYYFISTDNTNLYELKDEEKEIIIDDIRYFKETKEYIGMLKYAFKDDPSIANKVDNINLDHKSLIKITNDYHNQVCKDEECIIYEKKLQKTKRTFGIVIGLNSILISETTVPEKYYFLENSDFGISFFPSVGIFFKWNLPYENERLYFQYEGTYSYKKLSTSNSYNSEMFYKIYLNDISLTQNTFSNSVHLKYEFPKVKMKPSFLIGGFVNYFFMTDYNRDLEIQSSLSDYIYDNYQYTESPFSSWDYGISGGIGLKTTYLKDKEIFLELRYNRGFGLIEGLNTNTFLMNIGFQIGK